MRIAIEAQRIFRRNKHGMDFVALECIRELQKMDKVNEYYILSGPGDDIKALEETSNFHILIFGSTTYPLWEQIQLPLVIRKIKPDFLHCTSNTAPVFCRVPLILTLHDIIFLEKRDTTNPSLYQNLGWYYRRLVLPRIVNKCKAIITVSYFEAETIRCALKIEPDKVIPIYNGYNSYFKPILASYSISKKYINSKRYNFFIGNTDPKKNTRRVLRAYAIYISLSSNPIPLLIADLNDHLISEIIQQEGLQKYNHFFKSSGYILNVDLPSVYSGACTFLYPSLRESFGIPLLEAMACGVPVITSNTSSMPEVAGKAALYVNPHDEMEIANSLILLEQDKILREDCIASGLERVKLFSWKKTTTELLKVYDYVGKT